MDLESLYEGNNGKIIYYNGEDDIINLPSRDSLCKNDFNITNHINESIENSQDLYFMPINVSESDTFNKYILKIYGILMNGIKVEVIIDDIEVFFDIIIPNNKTVDYVYQEINNIIISNDLQSNCYHKKEIEAFPLYGFLTQKKKFIRIFSNTKSNRSKLIKFISLCTEFETYSNDINNYYRKASRENKLSLSNWVILKNYKINNNFDKNSICEYTITIQKENYKIVSDNDKIINHPLFIKDRTLLMAWDIETYSDRKTGEVPNADYDNDQAFMICLTIHWLHDPEALYKICIVNKETESDSRWTTIICNGNELDENSSFINVIKAMVICWNHFKPDIFSGYNDSGYDWPFIIKKMIKFNILKWAWNKLSAFSFNSQNTESIIKYNYNDEKFRTMKINAERDFYYKCPTIPGCLCIDTLPCYMKIYPKLETNKYGSLNFYLKDNNLPNKVDLSPITLWENYESNNPKKLREIAYYCIVDTISVQRLLVKRSIIPDYREIASLAYLSLSDSYHYAGGIKVCNLVAAYAWDIDILINMRPKRDSRVEKYPGAYVFPPDKGITPDIDRLKSLRDNKSEESINNFIKDRPVICLDFASLYPSLIMTYNLSPEKILLDSSERNYWTDKGYKLNDISFSTNLKEINAWSIHHKNNEKDMGLFPTILSSLFSKRKKMKHLLKICSDKKELYELILSKKDNYSIIIENLITKFNDELSKNNSLNEERISLINFQLDFIKKININDIELEYSNLCFEYNCINKKQNALKIYMNTFYGETGNQLSPFFLLELAGGITSLGQYNIKLVAKYVQDKGYFIKYGDTDSLYLTCPTQYFEEIDKKYINYIYEIEEYFTNMIKISLKVMLDIEKELNNYLENDNGTKFLKLEGECCIYPCVFLGKKKYFGIQHITEVNFNPKKIYIKGVDIIKQGKSGIEKEIGNLIIKQSVNIKNEKKLINIVKDIISDAIDNTWDFEYFIQSSSWKPNKNNISVHQFVKRMKIRHEIELKENKKLIELGKEPNVLKYLPLEPGERFNYVLIKNNIIYDHKGRKINIKAGDMMEYAHIAKSENMKIDISYYLIHYVIGTCARFINSEKMFLPEIPDIDEKKNDDYSNKMAKSYLEKFIKSKNTISEEEIVKQGKICKQLFKNAVEITSKKSLNNIQKRFLNLAFDNEEDDEKNINNLINKIFSYAESYAKKLFSKEIDSYCISLCEKLNINPKNGSDIDSKKSINLYKYLNISSKFNIIGNLEYNLRIKISNNFNNVLSLLTEYKVTIIYVIEKIKNNENIFVNFDYSKLTKFVEIWNEVVGFELYKFQIIKFNEFLNNLKCKRNNLEKSLTKNEINELIKNIDSSHISIDENLF